MLEIKQRMHLREHPYLRLCATRMNRPVSECVTFPSALLCVQPPVRFFDMLCQPSLMSQGIVGEFLATVKTTEKKYQCDQLFMRPLLFPSLNTVHISTVLQLCCLVTL